MPRFWYSIGHLIAVTAVAALPMLIAAGIAAAQESKATEEKPAEADSETADPFIVPEGKDAEELQEFLAQLTRTPAAEQTRAGFRAHFGKLYEASNDVLQRNVDDETSLLAVSIMTGSLDLLDQFGDRTAADRKAKLLDELKQHQRPAVATRGRLLEVEGLISQVDLEDKASVKGLIDQVSQTLKETPLTIDHGRLAYSTVSALEQSGDPKLVEMAAKAFAAPLRASEDPTLTGLAATLEGTARRLNLKGNPLKLTGTTLAGEEFTIDQWKGKVVIVDFWATWCGPCIAELPNLQALYEERHDQGLEVVGISLDESRAQLEEFLHKREIKWPTIFTDPQGGEAWNNPIATHYGVSAIPTVFLVGRDGKVVSTELYGEELIEVVENLLENE